MESSRAPSRCTHLEGPEVDDEDDVGPEVAEHLGDHGEGALEGPREPVLVLVHDQEGVDLLHLVAEDVHDLVHELGVVRVLEARRVHHGDVRARAHVPVNCILFFALMVAGISLHFMSRFTDHDEAGFNDRYCIFMHRGFLIRKSHPTGGLNNLRSPTMICSTWLLFITFVKQRKRCFTSLC